jgi:hypothetical protein
MQAEVAMRPFVLGLFLSLVVLFPKTGNAQVDPFRTAPPEVTAAAADWQINSEPVLIGGLVYYPTRGFRFFDGQVMSQIGVFAGVPVYGDLTLEPFSVLYVPIGRDRMREYERRRDRELAGTTGSRAPVGAIGTTGMIEPSPRTTAVSTDLAVERTVEPAAVDTSGAIDPRAIWPVGTAGRPDRGVARRTLVESIPRPSGANGIWIEFNGARWYASGSATTFSPDRFEAVGQYRGFPVYRDKSAGKDEIWIAAVKDGPMAPYSRR